MTTIGDMLGSKSDELVRYALSIGDVHILPLGEVEGITPKDGDTRNKFFVVLGFDGSGNVIGGIVVNSKINHHLPSSITDYYMPLTVEQCPFLKYNSFANCSHLVIVKKDKFDSRTYRGRIEDEDVMNMIVGTLHDSPYISKRQLEEFGI